MGGTNREDPEAPAMLSIPQVHLSRATETHIYTLYFLWLRLLYPALSTLPSQLGCSLDLFSGPFSPLRTFPRQMFLHMGPPDRCSFTWDLTAWWHIPHSLTKVGISHSFMKMLDIWCLLHGIGEDIKARYSCFSSLLSIGTCRKPILDKDLINEAVILQSLTGFLLSEIISSLSGSQELVLGTYTIKMK